MNTATANLENDHVHILRLIDVMEHIVLLPQANFAHLEEIVDLIRAFADGLHHAKEENLLFPLMVEKGFSTQNGPIAVMLSDHVEGRNYVKGISANIEGYKAGSSDALDKIHRNMKGYTELLKAHIGKENNVLFRMADNALSPQEQQLLLAQFAELEIRHSNGSKGFVSRIDVLCKAYNL